MRTTVLKSGLPRELPALPEGKWVGLANDGHLIAVGETVQDVLAKAAMQGENAPIITGNFYGARQGRVNVDKAQIIGIMAAILAAPAPSAGSYKSREQCVETALKLLEE